MRYAQPAAGYRTGIEPVLLAAACPARAGERVLELGTGAGAGLLCLAWRVAGVVGVGVEVDPAMAAATRDNFGAALAVVEADVMALPELGAFDHVIANPPWHGSTSTPSPIAGRRLAKQATAETLPGWVGAGAGRLRAGGSFTLVLPAASAAGGYAALGAAGFGAVAMFPLWPRAGVAARLILLQARLGARGPSRVLAGGVLHDGPGWTAWADAVLREGGAIALS